MNELRIVLIMIICSTLTIVLSSLGQSLDAVVYTTYDHVSTLEPVYAAENTASAAINMMVYESLIRPAWLFYGTETGEMVEKEVDFLPMLATAVPSLENGLVRIRSDGGVDYYFPIRQGVKFHNGEVLTPEDVEYTYERAMILGQEGLPDGVLYYDLWLLIKALLGPEYWSIEDLAWDIADEKGITGVTEFEQLPDNVLREACTRVQRTVEVEGNNVVFHLDKDYKEFATFLSILAHGDHPFNHIVNKKWVIQQGGWPGTCDDWVKWHNRFPSELHDKMNGTGPFKLQSWTPDQEILLVAHDDYWDGRPKLREFSRKEVTCPETMRVMILGGQADIANIPPTELPQIVGQPGVSVLENLPLAAMSPVIFFNASINAENNDLIGSGMLDGNGIYPHFFDNVKVRQAFAYAFNYWRYNYDILEGKGVETAGPIPRALGLYCCYERRYYYDLEKASELFKEVGAPWPEYGEIWNTGFKFTIPYTQGNKAQKRIAELIKEGIEILNPKFHIEVREVSRVAYLNYMREHKMPIFITGWLADTRDPDNFVRAFMHSHWALMGYQIHGAGGSSLQERAEKVYDPLIEKAAKTTNVEERRKLYFELQKLAFEDAIQIYLPQATGQRVVSGWVYDLPWSPMWAEIFVWNMTIKRK